MAKFETDKVKFSGIDPDILKIGRKISATSYVIDENGKIVFNKPVINAIDIDWNNANVEGLDKQIKTSADVLELLGNLNIASKNIPSSIYDLSGANSLLTQDDLQTLKPQLTGKSAYEIAQDVWEESHSSEFPYSTEALWIASLKGATGDRGIPGVNGKSAYETAQQYYQSIGEEFPYQSEMEWIHDIISGNGDGNDDKEYIDNKINILRDTLLNTINDNVTTINLVDNDHLLIRLTETENVTVDENNNQISTFVPPLKYDISLKDIASKSELDALKITVDTLATTEITDQINQRINDILDGASESFDTLKEIEDWIHDLPLNPTEVETNINDLWDNINNIKGELTEEVEQQDQHGETIYVEKIKTFDKTGGDFGQSLEEINNIINEILNSVSTAKDVQDNAEENIIDSIIPEDQSFTIGDESIITNFIKVTKPEDSKIVSLGVNTELLNNIIENNNSSIINVVFDSVMNNIQSSIQETVNEYVDEKLAWDVV